jgi:hypothetical protein
MDFPQQIVISNPIKPYLSMSIALAAIPARVSAIALTASFSSPITEIIFS